MVGKRQLGSAAEARRRSSARCIRRAELAVAPEAMREAVRVAAVQAVVLAEEPEEAVPEVVLA